MLLQVSGFSGTVISKHPGNTAMSVTGLSLSIRDVRHDDITRRHIRVFAEYWQRTQMTEMVRQIMRRIVPIMKAMAEQAGAQNLQNSSSSSSKVTKPAAPSSSVKVTEPASRAETVMLPFCACF